MKTLFWLVVIAFWALCPSISLAEDFLGAPVMPGGKVVSQTDDRLEKIYDVSFDSAVSFFKEALKEEKDIVCRNRDSRVVFEDHSNRPWHSIAITKVAEDRTEVVFLKDNWTWILGTLTLRFFGVFVVLLALHVALAISGAIVPRLVDPKPPRP